MKTELKVGDRVAVYDENRWGRKVGTVILSDRLCTHVLFEDGDRVAVRNQQCRRLKKRERRSVWINEYNAGLGGAYWYSQIAAANGAEHGCIRSVEFREVRK